MTQTGQKVMIEKERYLRQQLLWGAAGQRRLNHARVAVVGLDHQGTYLALCLTALGVGNVVLIDGTDDEQAEHEQTNFLGYPLLRGARTAELAEILQRVNPQVTVEAYPTNIESRIDQEVLHGANVIVETTNKPCSKELAIMYARQNSIPVLSTSSLWGYTKLMLYNPSTHRTPAEKKDFQQDHEYLMPQFEGKQQDLLMALVMCGITTEEVRKIIFDERDAVLKEPVRYRLGKGYRFGFPAKDETIPLPNQELYRQIKVAFLGSGAIGCWAAPAAAAMGFGSVDVFDYDIFESHNINRQVLGFDGVGTLKAPHVADKIRALSGGKTASTGYNTKILPGFETETKYDLVFDFVDNPYTRAVNTAYAVAHGIPMISAGALPHSARTITQVDGKTQCQDCVYQIYAMGREDEMIRRASCAANPDPSVVMSNAIAGALAMLETYTIVEPEKFGEPFNGEQTYRSTTPKRFGTRELAQPCGCYQKPLPNLVITDEEVTAFATAHPEKLRQQA